jgi:hypothetical protein
MSENEDSKSIEINKGKYKKFETATGAKSVGCGDKVSTVLGGLGSDHLFEVGEKVLGETNLREKYGHLNFGMQRMNIGNRIRGFIKKRDKEIAKAQATEGAEVPRSGEEIFDEVTAPIVAAIVEAARVEAEAKARAKAEADAKRNAEQAEAEA